VPQVGREWHTSAAAKFSRCQTLSPKKEQALTGQSVMPNLYLPTWKQFCGLKRVVFSFLKATSVGYMSAAEKIWNTGRNGFAILSLLAGKSVMIWGCFVAKGTGKLRQLTSMFVAKPTSS